jgi:hypothetical protein
VVTRPLAMTLETKTPLGKAVPQRRCDKCDAEMTHLSDLAAFLGAAPIRIFRCYNCNFVVSENR